jgi:hypothetical protein
MMELSVGCGYAKAKSVFEDELDMSMEDGAVVGPRSF